MKPRLFAVFALCAVACQKPGAAKDDAKGEAPTAPAVRAAGGGAPAIAVVATCPQSLGGTDRLHRVISKDCGVVPVVEDYYVDGGSLTLEAGASLSFKDGTGLFVGYHEPARLIVQGSAADPVVFTAGGDRSAGAWRGVSLNAQADRSAVEGLVIEFAGADEGALFVDASDVTLKLVKIREVKGAALRVGDEGSFAAFGSNDFSKKVGAAAAIDVPARALAGLGGGNRFDPGAHVRVRGGVLHTSSTWRNIGAPLVLVGEVQVAGDGGQRAVLELAPGLELRFSEGGGLMIGDHGLAGLIARGTAEAGITFTAHERPVAGGWHGVGVYAQGEADIEKALFEFGGRAEDAGALFVRGGSLALKSTTFRNDKVGVSLDADAKLVAFEDNTFVATPVAVTLPAGLIGGLGESNAYDRDSKIRCAGGGVQGKTVWHAQGAVIELGGEVDVEEGELTIEAGVALLAGPDAQLRVGAHGRASLKVRGTVASPVTIGPADAARGSWRGIVLVGEARANVLEHLLLTGASNDPAIQIEGAVDAKLRAVHCARCSRAVLGWSCGAKVTSVEIVASEGTPKLETPPEGC